MELTNEHKNSHTPEGEKASVVDKTNKETPVKIVLVDDVELNEEQLDIISGGDGLVFIKP